MNKNDVKVGEFNSRPVFMLCVDTDGNGRVKAASWVTTFSMGSSLYGFGNSINKVSQDIANEVFAAWRKFHCECALVPLLLTDVTLPSSCNDSFVNRVLNGGDKIHSVHTVFALAEMLGVDCSEWAGDWVQHQPIASRSITYLNQYIKAVRLIHEAMHPPVAVRPDCPVPLVTSGVIRKHRDDLMDYAAEFERRFNDGSLSCKAALEHIALVDYMLSVMGVGKGQAKAPAASLGGFGNASGTTTALTEQDMARKKMSTTGTACTK